VNGEGTCPDGIPAGYYPDLTNKSYYCKCTGTDAPSRREPCLDGLQWDSVSWAYINGDDNDGISLGSGGHWGTIGGICNWDYAVSDQTRDRPPWTTRRMLDECDETPTVAPTLSKVPTNLPSDEPSLSPSKVPTAIPSAEPSNSPSKVPTNLPSDEPSPSPSKVPTALPSDQPSISPSKIPTALSSDQPSISPNQGQECDGTLTGPTVTEMDLSSSTVDQCDNTGFCPSGNSLHLDGGELRYNNVGTFKSEAIDLRVTVTSGNYTKIAQTWTDREKIAPNGNGLDGQLGNINLQTIKGEDDSGRGNFQMCFVKQGTNEIVELEQFNWTVFDLDWRSDDTKDKKSIKERMIVDVGQAQAYQLGGENSELVVSCEDDSAVPCNGGVRTIFLSTKKGGKEDNPNSPEDLRQIVLGRSVSFNFTNTSCWTFTYDHFCEVGQNCKWSNNGIYSGGNFLFSAKSNKLIEKGECLTPQPTISPSLVPSSSPINRRSDVPSSTPINSPSVVPSSSPINSPSDVPSSSPITSPSDVPSKNPIAKPACRGKGHTRDNACKRCLKGYKHWPCRNKKKCTAGCFTPTVEPTGCKGKGYTSDNACKKCLDDYKWWPCDNNQRLQLCTAGCFV